MHHGRHLEHLENPKPVKPKKSFTSASPAKNITLIRMSSREILKQLHQNPRNFEPQPMRRFTYNLHIIPLSKQRSRPPQALLFNPLKDLQKQDAELGILTPASIRIEVQRPNWANRKNKQASRSFRCRVCWCRRNRVSVTESRRRGFLRFARSLLHDVDCSQVFAGWCFGGRVAFLQFSGNPLLLLLMYCLFIVPTVSAHFVTAVYVGSSALLFYFFALPTRVPWSSVTAGGSGDALLGHDQRWRRFPASPPYRRCPWLLRLKCRWWVLLPTIVMID
jgi:hypothetical protein